MSYQDHVQENRRLTILRLLEREPDYAVNDSVIQMTLAEFGHGVSRDVVRTDFAWLQEQGLTTVRVIAERVQVCKLTPRGVDVARGLVVVPGVQRPSPGSVAP